MLTLAGLGLFDEKDVTLRGIEAAKAADKVYIELYTSVWHGKEKLEQLIGKDIEILGRSGMEQGSEKIVKEAKDKDVVVFVPGDPLIATTHTILIEEAKKLGIKLQIIHNASIISAVCETGLHVYKFGASATVPFREKTGGKLPESVYETLKKNKKNDLHTLLLLDIVPEGGMSATEAIQIMSSLEEKKGDGMFTDETEVVVYARAGSDEPLIAFGTLAEMKNRDFGEAPMVMIVPGRLHFTERGFLEKIGK
jgi:diphthine synthase